MPWALALDAALQGRAVLRIRSTVDDAVESYDQLSRQHHRVELFHARYTQIDRQQRVGDMRLTHKTSHFQTALLLGTGKVLPEQGNYHEKSSLMQLRRAITGLLQKHLSKLHAADAVREAGTYGSGWRFVWLIRFMPSDICEIENSLQVSPAHASVDVAYQNVLALNFPWLKLFTLSQQFTRRQRRCPYGPAHEDHRH